MLWSKAQTESSISFRLQYIDNDEKKRKVTAKFIYRGPCPIEHFTHAKLNNLVFHDHKVKNASTYYVLFPHVIVVPQLFEK